MKGREENAVNIVLIGMPGVGKSTLGVMIAEALGMSFIDTDALIEAQQGQSLQGILNAEGVDAFLAAEESAVLSLRASRAVISTGGSVVYSERAMGHLKAGGLIVYLKASLGEIEERLGDFSGRGIVLRPGWSLEDTYLERLPLYERYGEVTVTCSELDAEACVAGIFNAVAGRARR